MNFRSLHCLLLILSMAVLLPSCAKTRVDYFGEDRGPVDRVDMYFAAKDIQKPYRVMGKATGTTKSGGSTEKLHAKFASKARDKGADAVLFHEMRRDVNANVSTSAGIGYWFKRLFLGSSATRSTKEYGYVIDADFIVYTDD